MNFADKAWDVLSVPAKAGMQLYGRQKSICCTACNLWFARQFWTNMRRMHTASSRNRGGGVVIPARSELRATDHGDCRPTCFKSLPRLGEAYLSGPEYFPFDFEDEEPGNNEGLTSHGPNPQRTPRTVRHPTHKKLRQLPQAQPGHSRIGVRAPALVRN